MKKKRSYLSVGAIAALALGGFSQAAPLQSSAKAPIEAQSKQTLPEHTRESKREILPDGCGGVTIPWIDHGRSPKEYGQWLQANRKQKWTKKR